MLNVDVGQIRNDLKEVENQIELLQSLIKNYKKPINLEDLHFLNASFAEAKQNYRQILDKVQ